MNSKMRSVTINKIQKEARMNTNVFKRNELLAQKTIAGLESRNMKGY